VGSKIYINCQLINLGAYFHFNSYLLRYDELAEDLSTSNKRPAYNDRSNTTNYSNNNYNNYHSNNQWNNNNNQSFNRNQSGSHFVQDVENDEDFDAYDKGNNQVYSNSYNGPPGDFPVPTVRIESTPESFLLHDQFTKFK